MSDGVAWIAPGASGSWATFFLADEMLAVPVEAVQEVLLDQPLTPVPLAPSHVAGLLNLRGQVMPAIDLRERLHFPSRARGARRSFLVLKRDGMLTSVVVDAIGDVLDLPADGWRPPPETLAARHRELVFGICPIDGRVVLGVRDEALHDENEPTGPTGKEG
jgi:purine-binding chemotaxis protein CheW